MDATQIQSKRGREQYGIGNRPDGLLAQITPRQAESVGLKESGSAYYIRPGGATLREVIILQPNGAPTTNNDGIEARDRAFREKGFEYIGPTLTKEGVERAVEVIAENRADYVLFLQEEIAAADEQIANSDEPHIRAGQRRRKAQFESLLEDAERPLNVPAMVKELEEIAKAQRLAKLAPEVREAMLEVLGDQVRVMVDRITAASSTAEIKQARIRKPKDVDSFVEHGDEA